MVIPSLSILWSKILQLVPMIFVGLLILMFFILIAKPVAGWLIKPVGYFNRNNLVRNVIQRCIQTLIILLGLYIFLLLAGLTNFAVAIVSGTGVIGIILGFAFRDIAENFISSLLLSVQRPFKIGDVVEISGHTGIVEKVTARATTLVDFDGNHIQIPNATVYKNIIKNLTANPRTRGYFMVGIGYESSIRHAQSLAMQIMNSHFAVLADPEPQVLIAKLDSATVNLDIYFWINSETHSLPKVESLLMRLVLREFEKYGISLPDEARERIFPLGFPTLPESSSNTQHPTTSPPHASETPAEFDDRIHSQITDDISSDATDIRHQAAQSRDPETGNNIL